MEATAFIAVALACAPQVNVSTTRALVSVESAFNPWAIGVVRGVLDHQPLNRAQALSTARALQASGWNFSVGLGQINIHNLARLGLTLDAAFEPCANLAALQRVLLECFERSQGLSPPHLGDQLVLRRTLSCYYSGKVAAAYHQGYVNKVAAAAATTAAATTATAAAVATAAAKATRAHPTTSAKEKS